MKVKINSSSKLISKDSSVYVIRPGKSGMFFNDFLYHNTVFLDYPGIIIKPGFDLDDNLMCQIQRSSAFARYYKSPEKFNEPPIDISRYDKKIGLGVESSFGCVDAQNFSSFHELYSIVKEGDIIVCPQPGGLEKVVTIAEVVSKFNGSYSDPREYSAFNSKNIKVPSLKVKWLKKDINKHLFSFRFIGSSMLGVDSTLRVVAE